FDSYRKGMRDLPLAPPKIDFWSDVTGCSLRVALDLIAPWTGPSRSGLSAVIEEVDGTKSYWALANPNPEKPDFHHPDCFAIELQDLGCRIYTFITTLLYVIEAAAKHGKSVWVLDRPNPAGRPIEGLTLRPGWESFVGAGPLPMRHGLTLGELGAWFVDKLGLDVDYRVIEMEGYAPEEGPGFGWPLAERVWINPSPNAPNLNMARAYAGTVMLEGTTLSEGRGTTRPLELFGAPDIDARRVIAAIRAPAPAWP